MKRPSGFFRSYPLVLYLLSGYVNNRAMNTPLESHLLLSAVVAITAALVLYTVGVWSERVVRRLKFWHLLFFIFGVLADIIGTSIMTRIARLTGTHDAAHTLTGMVAVLLMIVHAVWAVYTYYRGSEKAKRNFSRFSIFVWGVWLVPYILGIYLGMSLH